MLADARLVAYVRTKDLVRARAFYEGVLGLTVTGEEPGVLVLAAGAALIRLMEDAAYAPADELAVVGLSVPDLSAVIQALRARGVHTERTSFTHQDVEGVWTSPDGVRLAWLKDPDGATVTLSQPAP